MTYRPKWLSEGADALDGRLAGTRGEPVDVEVLVVGSGYGGAVAAARFARSLRDPGSGKASVCVLERGAEYVPGTFPTRFSDVPGHVRLSRPDDPKSKGRADGLYDFRLGNDVSALVANGLGGGSLINAGVTERPEKDVFDEPAWPAALRRDFDELVTMYAKAETMLGATPAETDGLAKYEALRAFASSVGLKARPTRVAVHFEAGTNAQGVKQEACIGCGDCVAGCNFRAKNTLPMNYLAEAKALGASMYTGVTVSRLTRDGGHWRVWFRRTGRQHPPQNPPERYLRARHVVLSAGTFGSTEILLRSRTDGLRLSSELGTRFSTNGDMISVLYGQEGPVNAAPEEHKDFRARKTGPTITGMFVAGSTRADRVVVQELAIPGPLRRVFEEIVTTGALPVQLARTDCSEHHANDDDPAAVHGELVDHSQVFAAFGDDGALGRLEMVEGWAGSDPDGAIRIAWKGAGNASIYKIQDELLLKSERLGGMYLRNPLWKPLPEPLAGMLSGKKPDGKLLTVHPLGGCPMGDDASAGVVDDLGRVYDPTEPADAARVHEGLLVLDGSIVPVALGINPLLTIAALAERASRRYARLQGWPANDGVQAPPAPAQATQVDEPPVPAPPETAVRFSERMSGDLMLALGGDARWVALDVSFSDIGNGGVTRFLRKGPHRVPIEIATLSLGKQDEPEDLLTSSAAAKGQVQWMERGESGVVWRVLRALLVWLCSRALPDLFQRAREQGWWKALSLVFQSGSIAKLASNVGETRYLRYSLTLQDDLKAGADVALRKGTRIDGLKTFRYALGANPWRQLSELEVKITPPGGEAYAAGILSLDPTQLVKRFTAQFQIGRQRDQPSAIMDVAAIGLFMLRIVLKIHFWSFRAPEYEKYDPERARRRLPGALDGLEWERHHTAAIPARGEPLVLPLTRYWTKGRDPARPPVMLIHGFGASGAQFAHPRIPHNLARHLAEGGFDVWVAELRTSIALPSSGNQWTLDEIAREDIPALAEEVLKRTRAPNLDIVAHCIGSAMFCTAVLGDVQSRFAPKVRQAVLLQVGPLITLSRGNRFRGYLAAAMRRYMLTDHVDSSIDDRADAFNTMLDRLLGTYPYKAGEQKFHSLWPPCEPHTHIANCNRSAAVFGRLFQHANVAPETLDLLGDLLGQTNLRTFEQTAQYAFAQRLTDHDACNLYVTDDNVGRRFTFPVLFLHGEKNDVFAPRTSVRSQELLLQVFGKNHPAKYIPLPGYGHLDPLIGRRAHQDVFPHISGFLRESLVGAAAGKPSAGRNRYPRRPLIGPVLGWTRRDRDGVRRARIWCRTDDEQSYASFLIAVVLDGAKRPVPGYAVKQDLRDGSGNDVMGDIDLLSVIDVALPPGEDDYEIVIVGAHSSTESNMSPEAAPPPADLLQAPYAADLEMKLQQPAPPGAALGLPDAYATDVLEFRARWKPAVDAADRARRVNDSGYFERADSVLLPKTLLRRLTTRENAIDFALASCRYSASLIDRERADATFGVLRDLVTGKPEGATPSLLLLVGDQIYADATAGLFDPKNRRGRYDDSYREAWTAPNARAVLRRLPTYMMMDDHEYADNWHPQDPLEPGIPESRDWALIAVEDYQLSHSPLHKAMVRKPSRPKRGPAGPYDYEFESGGFRFYVCNTRSERAGRDRIMSDGQMQRLTKWMRDHNAGDGRPMFVVSPSVVVPAMREADSDGWDAFPGSQREMFSHIAAEGIRNVVFLCGDSHLAMVSELTVNGGKRPGSKLLCVVGSPLYAPFPFANVRAEEFLDAGSFALDGGASVDYVRDKESIACRDSFTLVGAKFEGGVWWITVDVHTHEGRYRSTRYSLA